MHTLDNVIGIWEEEEVSIEEKLDLLEKHIFEHLWLTESLEYYEKKWKFFHRYAAGFIHRTIMILKDFSYIVLDPIHIFDILTTFVKNIFTNPIQTLKQIWNTWTSCYTTWMFWLWYLTADAMLAAMIAWARIASTWAAIWASVNSAVTGFWEAMVDWATAVFRSAWSIAESTVEVFSSSDDFFNVLKSEPQVVLRDAKKTIESWVFYWKISTYKMYTEKFLKRRRRA